MLRKIGAQSFFQREALSFLLTEPCNVCCLFSRIRMRQGQFLHTAAAAMVRAERRPGAGRCGYNAVHAVDEATCNEIANLTDKLSLVPATTMRGLRMNAALAAKTRMPTSRGR